MLSGSLDTDFWATVTPVYKKLYSEAARNLKGIAPPGPLSHSTCFNMEALYPFRLTLIGTETVVFCIVIVSTQHATVHEFHSKEESPRLLYNVNRLYCYLSFTVVIIYGGIPLQNFQDQKSRLSRQYGQCGIG